MRVLLAVILLVAGLGTAGAAPSKPEPFVEQLGAEVLGQLGADVPRGKRVARFEALMDRYLAVDAIAHFVLGSYWKSAEPASRQAFLDAFKTLLINRFLPAFEGQSGTRLEVRDARRVNPRLWAVRVEVRQSGGGAPTLVTLRLLKGDDGLKVADVITRGVSLGLTLREEYTAFLDRHDGNIRALASELRRRAAKLANS